MSDRHTNRIAIGGDNAAPIVQSGHNDGVIVTSGGDVQAAPADLLTLLVRLRAEVRGTELPRREVVEDSLQDLMEDVRAVRDRGTAAEVNPAVAKSRWDKVRSLLAGLAQFTPLVHAISAHVDKLFG